MTEIVLLYILTAMTAAGLILSILLLQKYGAAQTEIAALKAEQQRLAALQTEETRRSAQETAQALQNMQTNIQTNLQASMQTFGEMVSTNQKDSAENLDKRLADLNTRFSHMAVENEQKLENIRISMEKKIGQLNEDNQKQLEQMRQTVDEKLQKTLEERISKSFQLVSERLEQVYKGLGEMQNLAAGVGDLKKVLSNVKARGILGEVQLGAILEQILTPEQYEENVRTKSTGNERVEFAVKLPGDDEGTVWLPIDAKFPGDAYAKLVDAYELGDPAAVEEAAGKIWNALSNPKPGIFTINISNRRIRQISASCSCRLRGCMRRLCAEGFWKPCSATTRSISRVRPRWQHCSTACRWVSARWRSRSAPARSGMCSVRSRQSSTSSAMCWKARRTASIKPTRSWIS